MPVQTNGDDLRRTHRTIRDGFYVSHRIYIDKVPEKYTIEPMKTLRTGGRNLETGQSQRHITHPLQLNLIE